MVGEANMDCMEIFEGSTAGESNLSEAERIQEKPAWGRLGKQSGAGVERDRWPEIWKKPTVEPKLRGGTVRRWIGMRRRVLYPFREWERECLAFCQRRGGAR